MDTTFCQKRIISHASLATTRILYLVVWSSWAKAAQGWLSQPSPCPEGPQAVPVGLLWHRWRGRTLLDFPWSTAFPPPLLCGVFVLVLGVSQHNTEALCSTQLNERWSLMFPLPGSPMFPLPGSTFPCNTDSTNPFSQQFHPLHTAVSPIPPCCEQAHKSEGQDNTSGIFSPAPLSTTSLPLQRKKKFNWCDTLQCWQAHTK